MATFLKADGEVVAVSEFLPTLSGVGANEEEATAELREALQGWIEVLKEQGLIPPLEVEQEIVGLRHSITCISCEAKEYHDFATRGGWRKTEEGYMCPRCLSISD